MIPVVASELELLDMDDDALKGISVDNVIAHQRYCQSQKGRLEKFIYQQHLFHVIRATGS